ncbi:hypothetical protein FZEAL_733 [Fusarium zealandicum]|uniref:F-box domain-containing protein n=1 Tax=Fusarium zealandicum TaxID=1053134 RepID=A0A8H4UUJ9_9HYPO|nr:hypothetical protein FZEAL_733 [Fusarium zealandicum]
MSASVIIKPFWSIVKKATHLNTKEEKSVEQSSGCFLLQRLPPDVVLCITDELPLRSQVALSQTCSALKNILYYRVPKSGDMPYTERVDFVVDRTKKRLGHWTCDECTRCHPINTRDCPGVKCNTTCPSARTGSNKSRSPLDRYHPESRHVQLALKYASLKKKPWKHARYLKKLMKPRSGVDRIYSNGIWHDIATKSTPKIVNGRFLLQTIWIYTPATGEPDTDDVLFLLRGHAEDFSWYQPKFHLREKLAEEESQNSIICPCYGCKLRDVSHKLCETKDIYFEGYDPETPTDYIAIVSETTVMLVCWQDLGFGDSPLDLAWMRQHLKEARADGEGRIGYEIGGVVDLFDGAPAGERLCLYSIH